MNKSLDINIPKKNFQMLKIVSLAIIVDEKTYNYCMLRNKKRLGSIMTPFW